MIRLEDIIHVMDKSLPVIINENGISDYYENVNEIDVELYNCDLIEYITQNAESEIVIEL